MPGVFRNRVGCYAPLIFDACMIEILARRLCCDDPSSLADFDADSSDTNPSWSFLSYWKEGLASRNCVSPRLWLAAMSSGFKLDPSSISFRLLLPKSTAEGSFEDICTHPVALQRGVGLSKLASWDGTSAIMAESFKPVMNPLIQSLTKVWCLSTAPARGQALKFCPAQRQVVSR